MKQQIVLITTAIAALLFAAVPHAQTTNAGGMSNSVSPDDIACTYNFGGGNLVWCVNANGNLMRFTSPAGEEHVRIGGFMEGYLICVNGDVANYYDVAMIDAGFAAPVLMALTATSVTINRATADGRFLLTQKWTRDTAERDLTVQMTLQNLGPPAAVKLVRSSDIDANNDFADDRWDKSRYGIWIRDIDGVAVYGLTLSPAPTTVVSTTALPTCAPAPAAVPGGPGDPAAWIIYNLGNMNAGAKKIIKVGYRAQ